MSLYKWWCDSVHLVRKLAVKCAACSLFWLKRIFRFLFLNHGWWWLLQPIIWFIFIPCILLYPRKKSRRWKKRGETESDQWCLLASVWLRMEEENKKTRRKSNIQYAVGPASQSSGWKEEVQFLNCVHVVKVTKCAYHCFVCAFRESEKKATLLQCMCVLCVSVCEYWGRQTEKRENSVYKLQQYTYRRMFWIDKRLKSERSTQTRTQKTVHFLLYI